VNHLDVLIVGAGPTGLTLACDLARWGVTCRIIDQADGPQVGSRGFALKPRTLDVLDDLGVVDRVAQAATDHTPIRFHLGQSLLFDLSVPPAQPTSQRPHPNAMSLPQWRTEAILRDRLAELGGKVEFGCRLTDLRLNDDGVTVTLERDATTETVHTAYLVGADGGRSFVRRHLGLAFTGATDDDTRALLADVHVQGLTHPDAVHLWMAAALPVGIATLALAGSPLAMAPLVFLSGMPIAPLIATLNEIAGSIAVAGTETETFTWPLTSLVIGAALGAALAGALADGPGWRAAVAAATLAAVLGAFVTLRRRATLARPAFTG
jgi:2-polyprenyl-6-methoxyphenol hydroxylase-like FAD-dependent oxidoreductase